MGTKFIVGSDSELNVVWYRDGVFIEWVAIDRFLGINSVLWGGIVN